MASKVLKFPVELLIQVADVNDQLTAGFAVIQIDRSTNGKNGVFEEITNVDTRPVLKLNQKEYIFIDGEGSPSYFYRFRLANAAFDTFTAFSAPFAGGQDPALDVCSIEELKELYLFGIDLTDDAGRPMPDRIFEHYIRASVSWLEHRLDIPIRPIEFEQSGAEIISGEMNDYYREDYDKYIWFELDRFPVIQITEIKLVLPGEAVVQVFEREWIHIRRETGQVQLVPGTGTAGTILLGASGAWIPLIYGNNRYIPDVFRVNYKAGFGKPDPLAFDRTLGITGPVSVPHPELDSIPEIIKDIVGKYASFGPLNIAGDLIVGAGIASKSIGIDGLSQSISTTSSATNAGFGARLVQYQKELKEVIPALQRYYKGLRMRVV